MEAQTVSRQKTDLTTDKASPKQRLLNAVQKLKPGGKALRVSFQDDSELNALRHVVYKHNHEAGTNIKSSQDPEDRFLYFFRD